MAGKQVMLDGQILHGRDRYGWWQVLTMEGWDATPEPKTDASPRPNSDGSFETAVHYEDRIVTLSGRLISTSPQQAEEARDTLTGLLHESGPFSVTGINGKTKQGNAVRGRISPSPLRGRYLPFQIELRFRDPYKYGTRRSFAATPGSAVNVFHRGNARAWSIITVSGSMPMGYTMHVGGNPIDITTPLVSGVSHVIDMKKRRLRVGGVWVYDSMDATNFPSVAPGRRQSFSIVPFESGSGTATAVVHDTYI